MAGEEAPHPRPSGVDEDAERCQSGNRRPGMPDEETVVSEETITSPKGRRYRVLRTRQTDPYDDAPEEQTDESS